MSQDNDGVAGERARPRVGGRSQDRGGDPDRLAGVRCPSLDSLDPMLALGRGRQWPSRPATMLIVTATITVPNTYERRAWRIATRRIRFIVSSASDTWKVMPTV